MDIVFARYRESDRYIMEAFNQTNCRIYVYDRGEEKLKLPVSDRLIHIEDVNLGREDCVYLRHIIENYDTIDGTIAFSQADNFDPYYYSDGVWKVVDPSNPDHTRDSQSFASWANSLESEESPCYKSHVKARFICDWNGSPHHPGLPLWEVWKTVFGAEKKIPFHIQFHPCATFATSGSTIRKNSLEFYKKLHQLSSSQLGGTSGLWFAWCIERFWEQVFSCE